MTFDKRIDDTAYVLYVLALATVMARGGGYTPTDMSTNLRIYVRMCVYG
jgi:hypothetical protein